MFGPFPLPVPSPSRDRIFAVALVLLAVGAAVYLGSPLDSLGHGLAVVGVLVAVLQRPAGENLPTRRFWRIIGLGLALFLVVTGWRVAASFALVPPIPERHQTLLYLLRSLFIVMAIETRPDARPLGGREDALRLLELTGAVLFVFALSAYVLVSPSPEGVGAALPVSARQLYVAIDAGLVLRLLTLRRRAAGAYWRAVFGWLGVLFVVRGIGNLLIGTGDPVTPIGTGPSTGQLGFLIFLPLIVAARIQHDPAHEEAAAPLSPRHDNRFALLVAYAFAFPIAHFLVVRLGVLGNEGADARELVMLAFLGSTAVVMWFHQRILVRENRRLEEERQALFEQAAETRRMDGLGRLAGGVAHDFNNLLTVIHGRTALVIAERGADAELVEDLEAVRAAARRGEALTRQLLAFGRRQMLRVEPLSVDRVLTELAPLLRSAVSEEVEVRLDVRANGALVLADQGQLEMSVLNLALNAREAMPSGGVLTIGTDRVELDGAAAAAISHARPGPYVAITVQDTGRGMSAATLKRIFDPFFTTKQFGTGAGLGLASVHGFVVQSGGAVTVISEPGRGAEFRIWLPVAEGDGELAVPTTQP